MKKKAEVKNSDLSDCEYSPLTADLLARVNKDFQALTSITEARINAVVTKYELIAKLEAPVITAIYPRSLVAYEVIPAATPAKGLLLSELKKLDPSLRDTPEKIAVIVEQHTKTVNEQKQGLAKLLSR